ncbi:MAG TPA: hypothetical protein VGA17_05040, partial [Nitrospiraceae bacterium]
AGMAGLAWTAVRNAPWMFKLGGGRLDYWREPPGAKFPMRRLDEHVADESGEALKTSPTGAEHLVADESPPATGTPWNGWTAWAGRRAPVGAVADATMTLPVLKPGPLAKPVRITLAPHSSTLNA